ncbi:hypothetical protein D3C81_2187690 [compost metagenome]
MLLREGVGERFADTLIFEPKGLMLAGGDLHVSVVLHERHDLLAQDLAANGRVVVPVISV